MVLQTVQAIGWRQPTFLLDRVWLEQPWKLMPKDLFDRLLDILLNLPEFFLKRSIKHPTCRLSLFCFLS